MAATRYITKEHASMEVYGRSGNVIAFVKNLSVTGACLEWTQDAVDLQKGDLVRLTIILRALNRKHNLNAEVIWREGNKSGVSFIKSGEVLEKMMDK